MKKIITLLAMTIVLVNLTGCLDDPDGAREKVRSSVSSIGL